MNNTNIVKVAGIDRARDARLEWRLNLLRNKLLEINVFPKERVFLDVLCTVDAESGCGVAREQTGEQGSSVAADLLAEAERVL